MRLLRESKVTQTPKNLHEKIRWGKNHSGEIDST